MRHELVHCPKERIVFINGNSVMVVGARRTAVRANEILVVRGCCVPYVHGKVLALLFSTSHVFALGGDG